MSDALIPAPASSSPLPQLAMAELLLQNLGPGATLSLSDLDQIRIPAGGSQIWELPGVEGPQPMAEIQAIILARQDVRAYWAQEYTGERNAPDCSSGDTITGTGTPGGACATCPHAAWGSAENGRGQACKAMIRLFLRIGDATLPTVLTLAPTSIRSFQQYMIRLSSARLPSYAVLSSLRLAREKNADGIAYSVLVPALVRRLSPDELAEAAAAAQFAHQVILPRATEVPF